MQNLQPGTTITSVKRPGAPISQGTTQAPATKTPNNTPVGTPRGTAKPWPMLKFDKVEPGTKEN